MRQIIILKCVTMSTHDFKVSYQTSFKVICHSQFATLLELMTFKTRSNEVAKDHRNL